jgi:hypothetical protein
LSAFCCDEAPAETTGGTSAEAIACRQRAREMGAAIGFSFETKTEKAETNAKFAESAKV